MAFLNDGLYQVPWIITALFATFTAIMIVHCLFQVGRWFHKFLKLRASVAALPGTDGHWFWGHLKEVPVANEHAIRFAQRSLETYPRLQKLYLGFFNPVVCCTHPETAQLFLNKAEPKPLSFGAPYRMLIPWLGGSIFLSSGDKWFIARKLLTPSFHFKILTNYMKIYYRAAGTLISRFKQEIATTDKSIEIDGPVSLCARDVILSCAFSHAGNDPRESEDYGNAMHNVAKLSIERVLKPLMHIDFLFNLSAKGHQMKKDLKKIHAFAYDTIDKRQKKRKESEDSICADFLDTLLLAKDESGSGMSRTEIREQIDSFLLAGNGTIGVAVSWILYTLAKYPHHQQKCREEVQQIFSDPEFCVDDPSMFKKMQYLTQCINETLRLIPPLPIVGREISKPVTVDGYVIPAGATVFLSIYSIHHNPTVWGDDHDDFKPERFSKENMVNMHPYSFIPFAAGPRNCLGQNMAMQELKVIVARILNEFELSVDEEHQVTRAFDITMRPVDGIKLFIKSIEQC